MQAAQINEQEFAQLRRLLQQVAGIDLSDNKRPLVLSRLSKRLNDTGHPTITN